MNHEQAKERRTKIVLYIKAGGGIPGAMRRFKVSHQTVKDACAEQGVEWPKRKPGPKPKKKKPACAK